MDQLSGTTIVLAIIMAIIVISVLKGDVYVEVAMRPFKIRLAAKEKNAEASGEKGSVPQAKAVQNLSCGKPLEAVSAPAPKRGSRTRATGAPGRPISSQNRDCLDNAAIPRIAQLESEREAAAGNARPGGEIKQAIPEEIENTRELESR